MAGTPIGPDAGLTSAYAERMALFVFLALVLFVVGVYELLRGAVVLGLVLIVAAFLIGPGGVTIVR